MADPVYSGELNLRGIAGLARRSEAGDGRFVTGLTRSRTELVLTPRVWTIDLGNGRRCAGLGRVEATWRIREILVNIAADYPPGGCNYRVIREHEDEHVAIARRTFLAWAPRLEAALSDAARAVRPEVASLDAAALARHHTDRLMRAAQPVLDAYRRDLNARDAAIDTDSNYRRLNRLCPAW